MKNDKKKQKNRYQNYVKSKLNDVTDSNLSSKEYDDLDNDTKAEMKKEIFFGIGTQCTELQEFHRVRRVEDMRLNGFTKREILYFVQHNFRVGKENAVGYLNKAMDNFAQDFRDNIDKETDFQLEVRWNLFKKANKAGKFDSAHKIVKDIAEIEGVYEYKPSIVPTDTEFDEADNFVKENESKLEDIREKDLEKLDNKEEIDG